MTIYKNISNIISWNILTAIANFALNFVLARKLGVVFFGEFSFYNAKIAFLGLIFNIIPTNFAVVKYQDDEDFKVIYFTFYIVVSIIFLFLLFAVNWIGFLTIPVFSMFLYSWPLFFISIIDTALQAQNELKLYFKLLFGISLVKLLVFFVANNLRLANNLPSILLYIGSANTISVIFIIFYYRKNFFYSFDFIKTIQFVSSNIKSFSGYYINIFIKSLADNFFIIFFGGILSKRDLGLFSLFSKSQNFSFSLFRTLEGFLMHRDNSNKYLPIMKDRKLYLGSILFLFTFLIVLFYMYMLNLHLYFVESIIVSFCAFSYVSVIIMRLQQLLTYSNKAMNITLILEMGSMLLILFILKQLTIDIDINMCLLFVLFSSVFRSFALRLIVERFDFR